MTDLDAGPGTDVASALLVANSDGWSDTDVWRRVCVIVDRAAWAHGSELGLTPRYRTWSVVTIAVTLCLGTRTAEQKCSASESCQSLLQS